MLQQYVATLQQFFEMSEVIGEQEPFLASLLEEMSVLGRSLLALNPLSFFEFQRRNIATQDIVEPPDGLLASTLVNLTSLMCKIPLLCTCVWA